MERKRQRRGRPFPNENKGAALLTAGVVEELGWELRGAISDVVVVSSRDATLRPASSTRDAATDARKATKG